LEGLQNKVAVVTGGASGIGLGIARLFAANGAKVAIIDIDSEGGQKAQRQIVAESGTCLFIPGDVSRESDVDGAVRRIIHALGPIYVLINNAGIRILGTVTELTEEQWDRVIDVDLKGVFLFSKACIPVMTENGGGVIINISSSAAFGRQNRVAYSAAKAGIIGLTKAMALDHRQDHIRVNCLMPGFTLSGMTKDYPEEQLQEMAAQSVSGRIAAPEDVAKAALFLSSKAAETITGAVLEM